MYLAMMVKAGCTHVVLEVSSQGMKQKRVATVDFAYGVWTNIETGDHIGPMKHQGFRGISILQGDVVKPEPAVLM